MSSTPTERPHPPADDDCCGGGACDPCVWDHYYAELQKWRIEQSKIKELAEQLTTEVDGKQENAK